MKIIKWWININKEKSFEFRGGNWKFEAERMPTL
jgi:hypothetical protein